MESPSSWIGQFHRKKASWVPRSPRLQLWNDRVVVSRHNNTCLIKSEYNPERGKPLNKETRLKAFGAQNELRTHINIAEAR